MSIRLKSRLQCPPGGFQFTQPQTGWNKQTWDFRQLCLEVQRHRNANPKFNLSTDLGEIMDEVDTANATRVLAIRGADIYVISTEGTPPKLSAPRPVAAGDGAKSGLSLLLDLLEVDPVEQELANKRAAVCVECPKNGKGDWRRYFTIAASETIKAMTEARTGLSLSTFHDEQLGICEACSCPLKLKVFCDHAVILKHTTPEVMNDFPSYCWIKKESQ